MLQRFDGPEESPRRDCSRGEPPGYQVVIEFTQGRRVAGKEPHQLSGRCLEMLCRLWKMIVQGNQGLEKLGQKCWKVLVLLGYSESPMMAVASPKIRYRHGLTRLLPMQIAGLARVVNRQRESKPLQSNMAIPLLGSLFGSTGSDPTW